MRQTVIVLGSGGHAKVLVEAVSLVGFDIRGICTLIADKKDDTFMDIPVLGNDSILKDYNPVDILLVNGIGSTKLPTDRRDIFIRMKAEGFTFLTLIHPNTSISKSSNLGEGCQVMAGTIIQSCAKVGRNVILNTGASIDHDCIIGDHSHIAPGVTLSGNVKVGECTHIGTGVNVIQGVSIGSSVVVGAGVTVLKNIPDNMLIKTPEHNVWC